MVATAAAAIVGVEVEVAEAVGIAAAAATKFFYLVTFLKRIACADILCGINKLSKVIELMVVATVFIFG